MLVALVIRARAVLICALVPTVHAASWLRVYWLFLSAAPEAAAAAFQRNTFSPTIITTILLVPTVVGYAPSGHRETSPRESPKDLGYY